MKCATTIPSVGAGNGGVADMGGPFQRGAWWARPSILLQSPAQIERGCAIVSLVPWFPDFVAAVELARRETRAAGLADPVAQYLTALEEGDASKLEAVWPGRVVIYDPRAGDVRGHRELRRFVRR